MSGRAGAIIDEANGSKKANNPITIVVLLRVLFGHCRGSIGDFSSGGCCGSFIGLLSPSSLDDLMLDMTANLESLSLQRRTRH